MSTSKVKYLGDLRTESEHIASGTIIYTDAPVDNNGKGAMFSPTDLVATALANCAMTIMGISAQAHNINIIGSSCTVEKIMTSNPRRISQIIVNFEIKGQEFSEKDKAILEKAAKTCPVFYSLHETIDKQLNFYWE